MSGRVERFEDLEAWKLARAQYGDVGRLTRCADIKTDWDFVSQIRRSALSVMNNLAEGFERLSLLEKRKFYDYARGSNGEVRSMTYAGEDFFPDHADAFQSIRGRSILIGRLTTGLIRANDNRRTP